MPVSYPQTAGNGRLSLAERLGKQPMENVASDQQIGGAVGTGRYMLKGRLPHDRRCLSQHLNRRRRGFTIQHSHVPHHGPQMGDDCPLEPLPLIHQERTEAVPRVGRVPAIPAGGTVTIQPVQQWIAQRVVPQRGGRDPTVGHGDGHLPPCADGSAHHCWTVMSGWSRVSSSWPLASASIVTCCP